MQCDVRQCPEDEIIPLCKTMLNAKVIDVRWDRGHVHLIITKGKAKLRLWMRPTNRITFEFYPGVDNIRFDGYLSDKIVLIRFMN